MRPGRHVLTAEATNTAGRKASSQSVLVEGRPPEGTLPLASPWVVAYTEPRLLGMWMGRVAGAMDRG